MTTHSDDVLDVTPAMPLPLWSWSGLLEALLWMYADGNATQRHLASKELTRMAKIADKHVELIRACQDIASNITTTTAQEG